MRYHLTQIWRLGLPLSLALLIQMVIIMVDSAFAGNISYLDLAAVSLAGSAFYIFLLLLIGIGIGSSVLAGQAAGANDEATIINCFRQGTLLCIIIGALLSFLLLSIAPLFSVLGQDPEVIMLARDYLLWIAWTLPLQGLTVLFRSYLGIKDQAWRSVAPMALTLILNAILNYYLTSGVYGLPKLGISGIGIASLVSNIILVLLILHVMGWSISRSLFQFKNNTIWRDNALGKLLFLSIPIAFSLMLEETFFAGSVFLSGFLGAAEQAAQQILLNTVGTSFLFNTGIGMACAILVGRYIGAKQYDQIMPTVKAGWILAQVFTIPFAIILLFGGEQWISLFLDPSLTNNATTIDHVKSVIYIALLMLFIDTIWLITIESLHGMLDTAFPALAALIAYWCIGGPLAYFSSQYYSNGFFYIWTGMLLAACLLTMMVYLRLRTRIDLLEHNATT